MRLRIIILAGVVVACVSLSASGHDPWMLAVPARVAPGESFQVQVGSGHSFPGSTVAIRENLLGEVVCVDSDGTLYPVAMTREANQWAGSAVMPDAGALLLRASLMRPRREEPVFEMTAIVLSAERGEGREMYALGQGFEIVPDRPVSELAVGMTVGFTVQLHGDPIAARVEVYPENGRPIHLSSTGEEPTELVLSHPGRYLLVSRQGGRGGSLVFDVLPVMPTEVEASQVLDESRDPSTSVGMTSAPMGLSSPPSAD